MKKLLLKPRHVEILGPGLNNSHIVRVEYAGAGLLGGRKPKDIGVFSGGLGCKIGNGASFNGVTTIDYLFNPVRLLPMLQSPKDRAERFAANVHAIANMQVKGVQTYRIPEKGDVVLGWAVSIGYAGNMTKNPFFNKYVYVNHDGRIVDISYYPEENQTRVASYFSNHNCVDLEDAYYAASMFANLFEAQIKRRVR